VPGCIARSHVSVLPPRPLAASVDQAEEFFRYVMSPFGSFTLGMQDIDTFDETVVVFLSIGRGDREVRRIHAELNRGPLYFTEPYPFHPHVTLAQGIQREQLGDMREAASRRWDESRLGNTAVIERATFVQNTVSNCWLDLADCDLLGESVRQAGDPA
jgi:2'-5' RNA ligase